MSRPDLEKTPPRDVLHDGGVKIGRLPVEEGDDSYRRKLHVEFEEERDIEAMKQLVNLCH